MTFCFGDIIKDSSKPNDPSLGSGANGSRHLVATYLTLLARARIRRGFLPRKAALLMPDVDWHRMPEAGGETGFLKPRDAEESNQAG